MKGYPYYTFWAGTRRKINGRGREKFVMRAEPHYLPTEEDARRISYKEYARFFYRDESRPPYKSTEVPCIGGWANVTDNPDCLYGRLLWLTRKAKDYNIPDFGAFKDFCNGFRLYRGDRYEDNPWVIIRLLKNLLFGGMEA